MTSKLLISLMALLLGACATQQQDEAIFIPPYNPEATAIPRSDAALQSRLGMIRAINKLGFEERRFNPCEHGLQQAPNCQSQYMTVLHFQLLCRDSTGTVSRVPNALTPLSKDYMTWKLAGKEGSTRTDVQGYGQLTMVSAKSTKGQRLILLIGKQFLGVTAEEASRLVLPKNFCG
jgi:hypothetical protein